MRGLSPPCSQQSEKLIAALLDFFPVHRCSIFKQLHFQFGMYKSAPHTASSLLSFESVDILPILFLRN